MAIRDRIQRGPEFAKGITTARLMSRGDHFEIIVKADEALEYKFGKPIEPAQILIVNAIFTDASKGMKASTAKLMEHFNTTDSLKIAEVILKKGEVQITTEQRRRMIEDKKKQIIDFIARHCVDATTGLPHPPLRIEQAMNQTHIIIDPFRSAEEQAREVIEALRPILPIKIEQIRVAIKIPPEFASKAYGVVKNFGVITKEEWQPDGSWIAIVEMHAGLHTSFLERVGKICQGTLQTKILK